MLGTHRKDCEQTHVDTGSTDESQIFAISKCRTDFNRLGWAGQCCAET